MPPDEFERLVKQTPDDEFARFLQQPPLPRRLTYDERLEVKIALAHPDQLANEELTRHQTAVFADLKSTLVRMREGPQPSQWPETTKMSRERMTLYMRLAGIKAENMPLFKGEDMSRVAIIDMLRCSNRPFPQDLRDVLANFLTALWWPAKGSHKKQRRLDYEAALLMETRDLIELLAAAQHEDTNDPNTQAAELVAKHYGMKLDSLRRTLTRYRAKRRRQDSS